MEIFQTSNTAYKNQIVALYIEAFSTGISKQYIDIEELNQYIETILTEGYAVLATEDNKLIGAILLISLKFDKDLPPEISMKYDVEKSIYVAEMMVNESNRGKGIGKELLKAFFESVDKSCYSDSFIRVWNENIPALSLYRKIGFEDYTTINQTKMKVDRSGTFVMKKIYLHKKLD